MGHIQPPVALADQENKENFLYIKDVAAKEDFVTQQLGQNSEFNFCQVLCSDSSHPVLLED